MMRNVFTGLLVVAVVILGYMCVDSIMSPIKFEEQKEIRQKAVIKRLIDIRKAQVEFNNQKKTYAKNFSELIDFVKNGQIATVMKKGELSDEQLEKGLTEAIVLRIQSDSAFAADSAQFYGFTDLDSLRENFVRDTAYVSVIKELYGEGFEADSLQFVPFTNKQTFTINVGSYTTKSGIDLPLFEACVPNKVYLNGLDKQEIINLDDQAKKLERYPGLKVGDASAPNNNAGNWE